MADSTITAGIGNTGMSIVSGNTGGLSVLTGATVPNTAVYIDPVGNLSTTGRIHPGGLYSYEGQMHSQNVIVNSSFLYGFQGWSQPPTAGLYIGNDAAGTYLNYNGTVTTAQFYNSLSIYNGSILNASTICLSGWVYNAVAGAAATIAVSCFNSSGTFLGNVCASSVAAGLGWTFTYATGAVLSGTAYVQVSLIFTGVSTGSNIAFSMLKLEGEGYPSMWTDEASALLLNNGQASPTFESLTLNSTTQDPLLVTGANSVTHIELKNTSAGGGDYYIETGGTGGAFAGGAFGIWDANAGAAVLSITW